MSSESQLQACPECGAVNTTKGMNHVVGCHTAVRDHEAGLYEREAIRAHYTDPKHKGNKSVRVFQPGKCSVCPATWSLTKHHIFGSSERFTIQLCCNCHGALHKEIDNGMVGTFGRHVIQILAQLFPVTAPLPEWSEA